MLIFTIFKNDINTKLSIVLSQFYTENHMSCIKFQLISSDFNVFYFAEIAWMDHMLLKIKQSIGGLFFIRTPIIYPNISRAHYNTVNARGSFSNS